MFHHQFLLTVISVLLILVTRIYLTLLHRFLPFILLLNSFVPFLQFLQLLLEFPIFLVPDDNRRILDREKDQYQRFLQSLRQVNNLEQDKDVAGEVSFDILEPFPPSSSGTLINPELRAALTGVGPMLRRNDYAVEIVVWTTMPSERSWNRALQTAHRLQKEAADLLRLPPNQQGRISAVAQPWISSEMKRPRVTVTLRRLKV